MPQTMGMHSLVDTSLAGQTGVFVLADEMHGRNVGMIELCGCLCLPFQANDGVLIRECRSDDLQGNIATERHLPGFKNVTG